MAYLMDEHDLGYLRELLKQARQPWPANWQAWTLQGHSYSIGLLSQARAAGLARAMPAHMPLLLEGNHWVWHAAHCTAEERSDVLQSIALNLESMGQISGWRNEAYACWGYREDAWPYTDPAMFCLERAAFRYFGMRSHASHVHGTAENGRMWCGRRSLDKPTDPGKLDNLAAGGLPAYEEPRQCAVREILEEAGLDRSLQDLGLQTLEVLAEREEAEGWHSERLFLYNIVLAEYEQPVNLDGEVTEFLCLDLPDVLRRMKAGEFTMDAACAIAKSVLHGDLSALN